MLPTAVLPHVPGALVPCPQPCPHSPDPHVATNAVAPAATPPCRPAANPRTPTRTIGPWNLLIAATTSNIERCNLDCLEPGAFDFPGAQNVKNVLIGSNRFTNLPEALLQNMTSLLDFKADELLYAPPLACAAAGDALVIALVLAERRMGVL